MGFFNFYLFNHVRLIVFYFQSKKNIKPLENGPFIFQIWTPLNRKRPHTNPAKAGPMHRQPLLQMLERYVTRYPDEKDVVQRVCQLVVSTPECFQRSCRPGHITGSAWVLSADRTECLLVHHRKLGRWLQPGGHADGQHQIEQVALREAQEESGLSQIQLVGPLDRLVPLDVDVHLIPERRDEAGNVVEEAHEHHDIRFLLQASAKEQLVLSEESLDLRWFTHQEVLEILLDTHRLRGDTIVVSLPATQVIMRNLTLPFRDSRRIRQVIKYTMDEHMPYDPAKNPPPEKR